MSRTEPVNSLLSENNSLKIRLTLVFLLGIGELLLFTVHFDGEILATLKNSFLGQIRYSSQLLRLLIAWAGGVVIFSIPRIKALIPLFSTLSYHQTSRFWLYIHLSVFLIFYILTWTVFENALSLYHSFSSFTLFSIVCVWLFTGIALLTSWLLTLFPWQFWRLYLQTESKTLLLALAAAISALWVGHLALNAWQPLLKVTFSSVNLLLNLIFDDVVVRTATSVIGTPNFKVEISPQCSGYEGIGLVTVFLCIYFWVARKQLRYPHCYLLLPVGIISIWVMNVLRIVMLITIGALLSPKIAAGGFHSAAGWITFVATCIVLMFWSQNSTFLSKPAFAANQTSKQQNDLSAALLVPFIALLSTVLISQIFNTGFDWLYPLKVLATGIALFSFKTYYQRYLCSLNIWPLLTGVLVFFIWIYLVPANATENQAFAAKLFQHDKWIIASWLFFRFFGSVIIVPLTEELAFRGYLLNKMIAFDFESVQKGQFTWFSFLGSSLLFGAMHSDWLAGLLAGLLFALIYYRRGALMDAILAHMSANALLSAYILYTGYWSLW